MDFSMASPRTLHIHGGSHKDITDGTYVCTDEKCLPQTTHNFPHLVIGRNPAVHPAMCNWGLSILALPVSTTLHIFHPFLFVASAISIF